MLYKWQAYQVHCTSASPSFLHFCPITTHKMTQEPLRFGFFFTFFLYLDLLQTLSDNLFYIFALWALDFRVPLSLDSIAEPVTLGTLRSGTEMELLSLDYQDKKLCHLGNLPGSEYELHRPKESKCITSTFHLKKCCGFFWWFFWCFFFCGFVLFCFWCWNFTFPEYILHIVIVVIMLR